MAHCISAASSAWLTAATWRAAEAGTSAAQTTRSANTNTTTSYVSSSAFTVTLDDVLDGVLLFCRRLNETGTVTVGLSDDNGATYARELTVNASDLPVSNAWVFFLFGSTLTGDGGSDYKVAVKGSSAANATFYRDGTAGNWSRLLRTTATGVPAAADNVYVAGELTGAGTNNQYTVTMDNTAATDHGSLDICQYGTLTWGVAAATAYYLKLSGDLNIWASGILNTGTVATPPPANSSQELEFDCASNVQYGFLVQDAGTWVGQGNPISYVRALLAADAAVNATSLTTDVATGWLSDDLIAVASTTQTPGQSEQGDLNGNASGTTLTVHGFAGAGGGLASAHSGTAPTQAEIINLTRNVKIHGASTSLQSYIFVGNTAVVDADYIEVYWMGSATPNKRGLDVQTTTGSFDMQYSALHDFIVTGSLGLLVSGASASNITYSNNVSWKMASTHLTITTTSGTWTVNNNVFINSLASSVISLTDVGGTFTNNAVVSATGTLTHGIYLTEAAVIGSWSGNVIHSNQTHGISCVGLGAVNAAASLLSATSIWRNGGYGFAITTGALNNVTFDGLTAFGNGLGNVYFAVSVYGVHMSNLVLAGDSTFSAPFGIGLAGAYNFVDLTLDTSSLGVASGIYVAHTTADLNFISANQFVTMLLRGTTLGSATQIAGTGNLRHDIGSYVSAQRLGAVGVHKTWLRTGVVSSDNAIFKTAAPSERLTPSNAAVKLESGRRRKTVDNSNTVNFSIWVRKSVVGDAGGADYNGNQPRLVLKANPALGLDADSVLDTMAVAIGNWEELTGTSPAATDDGVFEVVIDCDGTAGWVNVSLS